MSFLTYGELATRQSTEERAERETVGKPGVGNDCGKRKTSKGRETGQKQKAREAEIWGKRQEEMLLPVCWTDPGSLMHPALTWSLEKMEQGKSFLPWTALPSEENRRRASKTVGT